MKTIFVAGVAAALAATASGGALDECTIKGVQATVTRCLLDADKEAQAGLIKAEGDAGKRARDIDTATGKPGAAAALAKSMRSFSDYRKAQCDFVRTMYGVGVRAEQAQLGCVVDITRRRVRDLL